MNTFFRAGGFTQYHYVQHSNSPRYPYGLCGPFATEAEATAALKRIYAGFAGNACHMMSTDNAKARQRLEQLRA